MADLTLTQKYDTVLDVLYSESGNSPSFDDITGKLGADGYNIHWGEIMDILFTLDKEGLLYKVTLQEDPTNTVRYLLNFAGKMLKEEGGLGKKLVANKKRWHERNPLTFAFLTTLGAAVISVIVSVVTDKVTKQKDSQETQEIKQTITDATRRLDSLISAQKNTISLKKDSANKPIGN